MIILLLKFIKISNICKFDEEKKTMTVSMVTACSETCIADSRLIINIDNGCGDGYFWGDVDLRFMEGVSRLRGTAVSLSFLIGSGL